MSLGYDPSESTLDWNIDLQKRFTPAIDPKTLRPYKLVNNITWHENARKLIGPNEYFISYYKSIAKFVKKNKKIPTVDEFIIYIYNQEVLNNNSRICFKSKFEKGDSNSEYFNKITKSISKLPSSIIQNAIDVIENFSNAAAYLKTNIMLERLQI